MFYREVYVSLFYDRLQNVDACDYAECNATVMFQIEYEYNRNISIFNKKDSEYLEGYFSNWSH